MQTQIGENASRVWQTLGQRGETPLVNLPRLTKLESTQAHLAVGWLSRENKVNLYNKDKEVYIYLTDMEQQKYHELTCK